MKKFFFLIAAGLLSIGANAQVRNPQSPNPFPATPPGTPSPVDPDMQRRSDSIRYRSQFPQDSTRLKRDTTINRMPMDTLRRSPYRRDSSHILDDRNPRTMPPDTSQRRR